MKAVSSNKKNFQTKLLQSVIKKLITTKLILTFTNLVKAEDEQIAFDTTVAIK
jgi:hypothetical protein